MGEGRHFKFTNVQIDACMHDRLHVQGHLTSNFGEITNNLSETVQDRDIVTIED